MNSLPMQVLRSLALGSDLVSVPKRALYYVKKVESRKQKKSRIEVGVPSDFVHTRLCITLCPWVS